MPKKKPSIIEEPLTPFERAVLSLWVIHEAWATSLEIIEQQFKNKLIDAVKKRRLESKYTSFYKKAMSADVKTHEDAFILEDKGRKMMAMLSELGVDAYKVLKKQLSGAKSRSVLSS